MSERIAMIFDAHVCLTVTAGWPLPSQIGGALCYGANAAAMADSLQTIFPGGRWLHALPLNQLIGPGDPRFPSGAASVYDLQLAPAALLQGLRQPRSTWFPLLDGLRQSQQFLYLNLPPGAQTLVGVRKLAEDFPHTRFLLAPFRHGPSGGWQGQVRLAETENIWLTTLGLGPGRPQWDAAATEDAFYFAMGEVGASKVLYGSGACTAAELLADPESWLRTIKCVDRAQRELILTLNAQELFG